MGATTENPTFELNNALLSRVRVYVLQSLAPQDIVGLINRALEDHDLGLGAQHLSMAEDGKRHLADLVDGDARRALTMLEIAADLAEDGLITRELIAEILAGGSTRRFDKGGDAFYDQISALHKSVSGSDPKYIARRVLRMATEEIGNADPRALRICLDAWEAQERLGSPEGELALAQAVVYVAIAAKSNAVYVAYKHAMSVIKQTGSLEVPMHIRNAPTAFMKDLDFGKGYRYAHDEAEGYAAGEVYLPEQLAGQQFYQPVERGLEIKIKQKLEYLRQLDKKR